MTRPITAPRGSDSTEQRELVWKTAQIGIDLCRRGFWTGGLTQLKLLQANKGGGQAIPGLALTWFGYGIASQEGRIDEGIRYCRAGVDREVWRAESHFNLARTYLIAGDFKAAIAALNYGLGIEPTHPQLVQLRLQIGVRKQPAFPFLARGHTLNRVAGKLRHRLATAKRRPARRGLAQTNSPR